MKIVSIILLIIPVITSCDQTGGPFPQPDPVTITHLEWRASDMIGRDTLVVDSTTVTYRGVHHVDGVNKRTDTTYNAMILDDILNGIVHNELWATQSNMMDPTLSDPWRGELTMTQSTGESRTIIIHQRRQKDSVTNRLREIVYDLWQ